MNQYVKKTIKYKAVVSFFIPILLFCLLFIEQTLVRAQTDNTQPPLAINVDVVEIQPQSIQLWNEFSGRLRAVDIVEVKPRVGGYIQEVLFEDGAYVEEGDLIFVIDPRPYEIEIERIKGELESARSRAELARVELERSNDLLRDKMVPKREVDNRNNDLLVAKSTIAVVKAELKQARLNLEYASIRAPISGRISRAELTVGNLIETMMGAPSLTTIVATDRLYAEFDVDEKTFIETSQNSTLDRNLPVEMNLSSHAERVHKGHLHSFDNQLNISSGTIRARAIFENTDGTLLPGMFVMVRMGSNNKVDRVLLTERAIGTDQDKKYVYTVNGDKQVEYQQIELGRRIDGNRIILSGLSAGMKVIVNNIHLLRPGTPVNPVLSDVNK